MSVVLFVHAKEMVRSGLANVLMLCLGTPWVELKSSLVLLWESMQQSTHLGLRDIASVMSIKITITVLHIDASTLTIQKRNQEIMENTDTGVATYACMWQDIIVEIAFLGNPRSLSSFHSKFLYNPVHPHPHKQWVRHCFNSFRARWIKYPKWCMQYEVSTLRFLLASDSSDTQAIYTHGCAAYIIITHSEGWTYLKRWNCHLCSTSSS